MQRPDFLSPKAVAYRGGWLDICPAHDDTNPSLSITLGDNRQWIFHCFSGCNYQDIKSAYKGDGAVVSGPTASGLRKHSVTKIAGNSGKLEVVQRLLRESKPVPGTLGEVYLKSRGITFISDTIRFHPKLWYTGEHSPYAGLLIPIPSLGQPIALHRTYLNSDGRVKDRRRLGSPNKHGAYLLNKSGPLVVGEGLESTMSWWHLNGTLSCTLVTALDAATLGKLDLPDIPNRRLIIAPDNDDVGMRSAYELRRRAISRGWEVEVDAPPPNRDWNDILMERSNEWW
ncbi:toprim domain-containing protein [Pelagovum sp. HNIBRBA483]|uniref:DUF7146 domain-containing protein n=1 Tax=Pelagovum sp. HNIBRBA483 TaxID=3233341 RepID=UPI0034A3238B